MEYYKIAKITNPHLLNNFYGSYAGMVAAGDDCYFVGVIEQYMFNDIYVGEIIIDGKARCKGRFVLDDFELDYEIDEFEYQGINERTPLLTFEPTHLITTTIGTGSTTTGWTISSGTPLTTTTTIDTGSTWTTTTISATNNPPYVTVTGTGTYYGQPYSKTCVFTQQETAEAKPVGGIYVRSGNEWEPVFEAPEGSIGIALDPAYSNEKTDAAYEEIRKAVASLTNPVQKN